MTENKQKNTTVENEAQKSGKLKLKNYKGKGNQKKATNKHNKADVVVNDIERAGENVIVKSSLVDNKQHKMMPSKPRYYVRFKGHEDDLLLCDNLQHAREVGRGEYAEYKAKLKEEEAKEKLKKDALKEKSKMEDIEIASVAEVVEVVEVVEVLSS